MKKKAYETLYGVQVDLQREAGTIKPYWVIHEQIVEYSNLETEQVPAIFTTATKAKELAKYLDHKTRIIKIKVPKQ